MMQVTDLIHNGGIQINQLVCDIADKASLAVGDIVIEYRTKTVNNNDNLIPALREAPAGEVFKKNIPVS